MDDTAVGGMIGALFGILGGPIGVLLGGSYGALIGSALDAGDAIDQASLLEQIAEKMEPMNSGHLCICVCKKQHEGINCV